MCRAFWIVAAAAGLALGGCEVEQVEEGQPPDVEVEPGQLPEYEAETGEVEVTRDTVVVPEVEVETPNDSPAQPRR